MAKSKGIADFPEKVRVPKKAPAPKSEEPPPDDELESDEFLPKRSLLRIEEVARYFDVSDSTVRLWAVNGHFITEKLNGSVRILRSSVLNFRLRSRRESVLPR